MIKKHLELKTYTFNGVEVLVKINYDKGLISLCEEIKHPQIPNETTFKAKNWIFAERGLEYMAGWKEVLHAMEYAIESASNELKSYIAEVQKDKENSMVEILDMATELVKGGKKICKTIGCDNTCKSKGLKDGKTAYGNYCHKHKENK